MSIFSDPGFVEIFRTIKVEMRVLSVEPDAQHPTRPRIHFAGNINNHATMVGYVCVTPDDRIRWHFVRNKPCSCAVLHSLHLILQKSGEQGQAIWRYEKADAASRVT